MSKYHKIVNTFIFKQLENFFLVKTLRIMVLIIQNFVIDGFGIWDPKSGIRDPEKTYSGSATLRKFQDDTLISRAKERDTFGRFAKDEAG
jgi:hypothetical protein